MTLSPRLALLLGVQGFRGLGFRVKGLLLLPTLRELLAVPSRIAHKRPAVIVQLQLP